MRGSSAWVASLLQAHRAVALAASGLLYLLCLSGTLMVFHDEFARWEQPQISEFEQVTPAAVATAAAAGLARVDETPHHFFIGLPVSGMPRMTVTADAQSWYASADGQLLGPVHAPWRDWLETLHYYLTLPGVLGLTLVGSLGVMMMALVGSGLLALPRLFRDAFRLRLRRSSQLAWTDLHNRVGVWASPMFFAIALTGAAIGLASAVSQAMAPSFSEGDTAAFFAPIFGSDMEGGEAPAPLAPADRALTRFHAEYPDLIPWYVSYHEPATEGQSAEILAKHPRRLIYGDNYAFDDAGQLQEPLGLSNGPLGQQLIAAFYPLHFGSYGGLVIKAAYALLGLLACVVIHSGLRIWLFKRAQRGRPSPRLAAAWNAIVWGGLAALAVLLLVTRSGLLGGQSLIPLFWGLLVAVLVLSQWQPGLDLRRGLCNATALLIGFTLAWDVATHGLLHRLTVVHGVRGGLGLLLLLCLVLGWRRPGRRLSDGQQDGPVQPAVSSASSS